MLRGVVVALALFLMSSVGSMAGNECPPPHVVAESLIERDSSNPSFDPELPSLDSSSFRGLSLGLGRKKALNVVLRLGFPIVSVWSASERHIDFCKGDYVVGSLRFDESDQLINFDLRPAFFEVNKVVLREFADAIFKHYDVRPLKVDDDVCFGDVTCLRGTTAKGENFLIMRIAMDTVLHVSR